MRVLVMGAGAIGSLIGGFLAKAGVEVALVGRRWHVDRVRREGLRVEGPLGGFRVEVEAYEGPEEAGGPFDLALITVKAYDTYTAASQIVGHVRMGALPLCLQNGLGVEEEAARALGVKVYRGVTNNGAMLVEPGVVKHTGVGETLIEAGDPRLEGLVEALRSSGLPARLVEDIRPTAWLKALINAGINPLGAITGLRNGELLRVGWLRELMRAAVEEGARVAKAYGVELPEDPVEAAFKVAMATAENKNSMLQDLERGRRTEVDYICGAIASMARRAGLRAPINEALAVMVKALEEARVGLGG